MNRLATLLLAGFGAIAAAQTPAPSPPSAFDLVRAMRLDELAAEIANDRSHRIVAKGRGGRKAPRCVTKVSGSNLTDDLARALAGYLSPAEIASAANFYATSAGTKVVEHTFRQVQHQLAGSAGEPPAPATTPDEDLAFDAFANTDAGRKFVDNGFLLNTPQVDGVISAGVSAALARCRTSDTAGPRDIVPAQKENPLEREPQSD